MGLEDPRFEAHVPYQPGGKPLVGTRSEVMPNHPSLGRWLVPTLSPQHRWPQGDRRGLKGKAGDPIKRDGPSAPDWGSRGRRFESARPDCVRTGQGQRNKGWQAGNVPSLASARTEFIPEVGEGKQAAPEGRVPQGPGEGSFLGGVGVASEESLPRAQIPHSYRPSGQVPFVAEGVRRDHLLKVSRGGRSGNANGIRPRSRPRGGRFDPRNPRCGPR
jgi:hypothetical protein